jgi:hypothetical protein
VAVLELGTLAMVVVRLVVVGQVALVSSLFATQILLNQRLLQLALQQFQFLMDIEFTDLLGREQSLFNYSNLQVEKFRMLYRIVVKIKSRQSCSNGKMLRYWKNADHRQFSMR